ncbi:hypothetical protein EGI22_17555 [Lacihabitans sp. LS3-19]|uniref:hypothetical protein n=1 Tax=Lacihabitans sp. LS3-19 TaxID=2487335 RepID=UPI0020CDFE90|nr:hypothetical protein [Lacihabitans sp. LS3-19]MCP9769713.1 hypothetical protein [Lacihabitans sp. LS3-19]
MQNISNFNQTAFNDLFSSKNIKNYSLSRTWLKMNILKPTKSHKKVFMFLILCFGFEASILAQYNNFDNNYNGLEIYINPNVPSAFNFNTNFKDAGTNVYSSYYFYSYSSFRANILFRKDGYWYYIENLYAGSYLDTYNYVGSARLIARTAFQNYTTNLPCNDFWFVNNDTPLTWNPNSSTAPSLNNSYIPGFVSFGGSAPCSSNAYNISGLISSATVAPNFIQLPQSLNVETSSETPTAGKLTYDYISNAALIGNGTYWENIFTETKDINLSGPKKITFRNDSTQIYSPHYDKMEIKANHLSVKSNSIDFDAKTFDYNFNHKFMNLQQNGITFFKSITVPFRTFTASTTATGNDNVLIYTGNNSSQTITLPSFQPISGRYYILANQGNNVSINISPAIKNGFSTTISVLQPGESFHIVYDDNISKWRLISRSNLY